MVENGDSNERIDGDRIPWKTRLNDCRREWTVIDSETRNLKTVYAGSQKEALRNALRLGVYPRLSNHVRPRQGGTDARLMPEKEFQRLISKLSDERE